MQIKRDKVWIRIAGNAKRIKEGGREGWRCFISDAPISVPSADDEILLTDWGVSGNAVPGKNFVPGTFKFLKPTDKPILVAWIDMYGHVVVENGLAQIELLLP